MKSSLLILLTLFAASSPDRTDPNAKSKVSPTEEVGDLDGYYTCKGMELGGKTYSGICVITKKNEVYLVQWMVGVGSTFSGLGIRQGNNLAVSWTLPSEKGIVRGVNLYRIEPGPRLTGRWATLPGPGMMQSETLTFLKALDKDE
ncbi:MAG: hypothetical protein U0744_10435 [Gemmataceae bacterium]